MNRIALFACVGGIALVLAVPVLPDGMPDEETTGSIRDPRVLPDGRYDRRAYGPPYGDAEYSGAPHRADAPASPPCRGTACAQ